MRRLFYIVWGLVLHFLARPATEVRYWTKCLADRDSHLRGWACLHLAGLGDEAKSALPELEELLHDPMLDIRAEAALAVLKLQPGHPQVIPTFEQVLWADPPATRAVRVFATAALRRLQTTEPAAGSLLQRLLKDEDQAVRVHACVSLWERRADLKQVEQTLGHVLRGEDKQAQQVALKFLKKQTEPLADEILTAMVDNFWQLPTPTLVAYLIGQQGERGVCGVGVFCEALERGPALVSLSAAQALGRMGPAAQAAIPALRKATSSPHANLARAAAEALHTVDS